MSNAVKVIEGSMDFWNWNLGTSLGLEFENYIYNTLSNYIIKHYPKGVKVFDTPITNDGGKDIIIESRLNTIDLFEQKFYKKTKNSITIYIECKSSNSGKIRFEKAICNIAKIKELDIDYYILVTNSTITPYTFYSIHTELNACNIEFSLVDQYVLLNFLKKHNTTIGNYVLPKDIPTFNAYYQTYPGIHEGNNVCDLYVLCRNFNQSEHFGKIKLLTDRNWDAQVNELDFIIGPFGSYIAKLRIRRAFFDGIDDLLFFLKIGDKETPLHIKTDNLTAVFEPQLVGQDHYHCIDKFVNWITKSNRLSIHYLFGEAGIGKTRVLTEIYKKLEGRNIDFGFFKSGKKDLLKNIRVFLEKKKYISSTIPITDFCELISHCKHDYRRAIIILDDLHNIAKSYIDGIMGLANLDVPITIIICGRTDYSAGSLDYFTFVQWCIENEKIDGHMLSLLKPDETKSLIRTIIKDVPEIVEDKLFLSSKNNPLFIVQFIEYLLEMNLVNIVNRNTVGILNISTFANKVYIPEEIHTLYMERLNNLRLLSKSEDLELFLLILCFLGGSISFENAIRIFDEDMKSFSQLIKRSFIRVDQNGNVCFIHESLFLFFKKIIDSDTPSQTKISSTLLNGYRFMLKYLNQCDVGKLKVWAGFLSEAREYFSEAAYQIEHIDNCSNICIDANLYDYLYTMYDAFKNSNNEALLKNIILARIYITLHYKAPINAVSECENAIKIMQKTTSVANDKALYYSILEQKAHSMFHAGLLIDGELILRELQSKWILDNNSFDFGTTFDMMDRLSGVYIKYNMFDLAADYNVLSFKEAKKAEDSKMLEIALLTKSKLYFYVDPKESLSSMKGILLNSGTTSSQRIECSVNLSILIHEIIHNQHCDWDKCTIQGMQLLNTALSKSYTTSIIRSYLVLAVCAYHTEKSVILEETRNFISKGIDASIKFGVSTYIWQFYNLLGIVQLNLEFDSDHIYKTFLTSYSMMAKQNLLYLGALNLCYGNILAISNIGFFLQSYEFESEFYNRMSHITFKNQVSACDYNCNKPICNYMCKDSRFNLKNEYLKAKQRKILFVEDYPGYLLRDKKTNYFIVLS